MLILLFSCYYTVWKTYESNALNGFFRCERFWNYELIRFKGMDKEKEEEEAGKLLRSANYWRWLYNTEVFKLRMILSLIIVVFFCYSGNISLFNFHRKFQLLGYHLRCCHIYCSHLGNVSCFQKSK